MLLFLSSRRRLNCIARHSKICSFTILALSFITGRNGIAVINHRRHAKLFCNAFVNAAPIPTTVSKNYSSDTKPSIMSFSMAENESGECQLYSDRYTEQRKHPQDQNLWMYHVESTTSTMDEAKLLVENKFIGETQQTECQSNNMEPLISSNDGPQSFVISASSQSKGRGTSKRNWKSSQTGNALFTIGIQQSAWIDDLKSCNHGIMLPLTLLPLKVGSVVASRIQKFLRDCSSEGDIPKVTVKWPNDVLLYNHENNLYEKVAGNLIESSQDWFLIGIGVNVGYAPDIPSEGVDYGRKATALRQFCNSADENNDQYWVEASKNLGRDIAYDIHSWLRHPQCSSAQIGSSILNEWKSFVHWDMELILRDTPNREKVTLKQVLDDGRVVVEEIETGMSRTLVSDYFL